jgi:mono/diheme cytochrome c family protein
MTRRARVLLLCCAALAVAAFASACGTERIDVPSSQTAVHAGAVLFSQRCAGCHSLAYAATHGSAPNTRTAQAISGPNFNQRCERPVTRVLYAIENGGFSGAYMPQNIVVGQDAVDVAKFVATYAGRQAPHQAGVTPCPQLPIGSLPPGSGTTQIASSSSSSTTTSSSTSTAPAKTKSGTKSKQGKSSAKKGKAKKKTAHA